MSTKATHKEATAKTIPLNDGAYERVAQNTENSEMVKGLNKLLANEFALFTKTLNYHWNVTGPRFHSIHEFLEGHYRQLLETIDDVAERIREIGSQPMGTLAEFSEKTSISENPGVYPETSEMISNLLQDHDQILDDIKEMLNDEEQMKVDRGTEDFLTGLLKQHEEMAWMLKSHLS